MEWLGLRVGKPIVFGARVCRGKLSGRGDGSSLQNRMGLWGIACNGSVAMGDGRGDGVGCNGDGGDLAGRILW